MFNCDSLFINVFFLIHSMRRFPIWFWQHALVFFSTFVLLLLVSFMLIFGISGGKDDEKDEICSDQWLYDSDVVIICSIRTSVIARDDIRDITA